MQRFVAVSLALSVSGCSLARVKPLPLLDDLGPDRPECTATHRHQVGDFFGALGFGLMGVGGVGMVTSKTSTDAGKGIGAGAIAAGVIGLGVFAVSTHWGRVTVNKCQAAVARWDLDHQPEPIVYAPPPPPELTPVEPAIITVASQEQGFDAAARALALGGWPILAMDRGSGVIQTGGYSSKITDRTLRIAVVATPSKLVVTPMVTVVRGGEVVSSENWDNDLRLAFSRLTASVAELLPVGAAPVQPTQPAPSGSPPAPPLQVPTGATP